MRKLNLILIFAFLFFFGVFAQNGEMKVASFNMQSDYTDDLDIGNSWANRLELISTLIIFHDFDIMGTQECELNQVNDLKNALLEFEYDAIGRGGGTNPTDDEYSAIFYKTSRYKLLDNGDFWLSETPDEPSIGWDASTNRICTWGKFKELSTGFQFYAFNVHFDHIGETARGESAKLVLQKIAEIANDAPLILTGDFNVDQNSETYTLIDSSDILDDSYTLSPVKLATNGTVNLFGLNTVTTQRIDHVFISKDFKPTRYGILTDNYWTDADGISSHPENFPEEISVQQATPRLPSNHYPVVVGLRY